MFNKKQVKKYPSQASVSALHKFNVVVQKILPGSPLLSINTTWTDLVETYMSVLEVLDTSNKYDEESKLILRVELTQAVGLLCVSCWAAWS